MLRIPGVPVEDTRGLPRLGPDIRARRNELQLRQAGRRVEEDINRPALRSFDPPQDNCEGQGGGPALLYRFAAVLMGALGGTLTRGWVSRMHCGVFDSVTCVAGAPQAGMGTLDSMVPSWCSIRWSFGQEP